MNAIQQQSFRQGTTCDVRFDDLTRNLYATDASLHQVMPTGVAFPKNAKETSEVMRLAAEAGLPVTMRGAGTGLAGGAIGDGLIVELARHTRQISELNIEARTVRAGPGVVLDQLNAYLKPHGYWFGPDVATSSRATLGGMIGNNSSGARAPIYGTTIDHVVGLEVVTIDGKIANVGRGSDGLPEIRAAADRIVDQYAGVIRERLPNDLVKRWPGYSFDDYLQRKGDLSTLVCGSEGTLAAITSTVLNIAPLPKEKALVLYFFASVMDAMRATVEFLDLNPAAIEHIDRILFDQTRGQLPFKAARALMRLDEEPCEAILILELFDNIDDKIAAIQKRNLGLRKLICTDPREQDLVWAVRKQGLSLLQACKGEAKPTEGIEDVCVRPHQLPDYVEGLMGIFKKVNVEASFYGHAAAGLLHVKPTLDIAVPDDLARYRQITDDVSALCKHFKGSIAGEHGVGMSRTEYLADHLGPELTEATRQIKNIFDPRNMLNPGKILSDGRFKIDKDLRKPPNHRIELPFLPMLGYVNRDESFLANLDQCNGCGGCRKDNPTMCPTFIVTQEEIMSTRGRANAIRAALENRMGRNNGNSPLFSEELAKALDNCLSCKACKTECPSNVDLAQLKADLNYAKHRAGGVPLLDRMIANADVLGRLNAGWQAPLVNAIMKASPTRWLMSKTLGFQPDRPMPAYASKRFDRWFARRKNGRHGTRGKVILFDDTWVRYNEPNIGQAAVAVLEAAGFEVTLPEGRKCCGRPAMSRGVVNIAKDNGEHNIDLFMTRGGNDPIIFLEPSCYSMFIDDYLNLKIPHAAEVAKRCVQFEDFVYHLLEKDPQAVPFRKEAVRVAIHSHCHTKALADPTVAPKLAGCLPQAEVKHIESACCGMAGAFGMLKSKYELSKQVAKPLIDKLTALPAGTKVVASGTSCRHQITHLSPIKPLHMAELLAEQLPQSVAATKQP